MTYDWISFTTDYGLEDGFVAACSGVIARIAPAVRILHITHQVPPQDIRRAALVLAQTAPYLPPAIHLAVVDPGVGTPRRAIVIVTAEALLVGPDNGLLIPAAEALGGIHRAHQLTNPRYQLSTVSTTFHGRDIFAPAAAHLATGVLPEHLGPAIEPRTLIRLPDPKVRATQGKFTTEILSADRFGNLQLAARAHHLDHLRQPHPDLPHQLHPDLPQQPHADPPHPPHPDPPHQPHPDPPQQPHPGPPHQVHLDPPHPPLSNNIYHKCWVEVGSQPIGEAVIGRTFGDAPAGGLVVYVDSAGHVAIAVNGGSAAEVLGAAAGDTVVLTAIR
jgi:S-adenosyl-L-methionine hydrolase (adenosine-forming)